MRTLKPRAGSGPLWLLGAFYAAMAAIALYGTSDGIVRALNAPRWLAVGLAGAVELLAAALFAFADWRRTDKGERAIAARLLSAGVAIGVAGFNYYIHQGVIGQISLFVGASLAAYCVVVLHTEARRRDRLREKGKLPEPRQTYSIANWLASPRLVIEARHLADETPSLGRAGSLRAARAARAAAARRAAIIAVVHRDVAATEDRLAANLAVAALDFEAIGDGIHGAVNNAAVAGRYAAILGAAMGGPVALPAEIIQAPEAAVKATPEVPAEAPVSPATVPLAGEVLPAQDESVKPLPRPVRAAMARAAMTADPTLPQPAIAAALGVKPRTLRADLAGDTGSLPVISTGGKGAAEKAPKNGNAVGFQIPTNAE